MVTFPRSRRISTSKLQAGCYSRAADRIPEKIAHLIYLDSVLVESGRSAFSYYPPAEVEARIKAAEKATNGVAVPVPQQLPAVWGLGKEGDPDYDWVRRRLSPHPLQSYTTALTFKAPVGNNVPRTYIHHVDQHVALDIAATHDVTSLQAWCRG